MRKAFVHYTWTGNTSAIFRPLQMSVMFIYFKILFFVLFMMLANISKYLNYCSTKWSVH